jgi:hypothetical protein
MKPHTVCYDTDSHLVAAHHGAQSRDTVPGGGICSVFTRPADGGQWTK